jgi:hypothetical protein
LVLLCWNAKSETAPTQANQLRANASNSAISPPSAFLEHRDQYDRGEKLLDWSTTKNRKPHTIPCPEIAMRRFCGAHALQQRSTVLK